MTGAAPDRRAPSTGDPRRWLILVVVSLGQLMIALDATIASVMGPAIQADLDLDTTGLQWVFNLYIIPFGGLLLLGGRLNDVIGRRAMFLSGLALFAAASFLAGWAQSDTQLLAARALQGVAAAGLSPACLSILVVSFPDATERIKAFGVWGAVLGLGAGLGTLLGGAIAEVSWRLAFYITIPIAVALVAAALVFVAGGRPAGGRPRVDGAGGFTGTLGLGALVYGIVSIDAHGWDGTPTLVSFAIAAVVLPLFVVVESRVVQPLLPLSLFRARAVVAGSLGEFLTAGVMMPMFLLLPIYMQSVLGYSTLETGLAYIPTTLAMMIVAGPLSKLVTVVGPRLPYIAGVLLLAVVVVLAVQTPLDGSYWAVMLPITALLGVGLVLCLIPTPSVGTSQATDSDAGTTAAVLNVATQVGGALGLAMTATVVQSRVNNLLSSGEPPVRALHEALHVGMYPLFGWLALSLLTGLLGFRGIKLSKADLVPADARGGPDSDVKAATGAGA